MLLASDLFFAWNKHVEAVRKDLRLNPNQLVGLGGFLFRPVRKLRGVKRMVVLALDLDRAHQPFFFNDQHEDGDVHHHEDDGLVPKLFFHHPLAS